MVAVVRAPGVSATLIADTPEDLADLTADVLDDEELRGGIFTLAIRNASESGVPVKIDVELWGAFAAHADNDHPATSTSGLTNSLPESKV